MSSECIAIFVYLLLQLIIGGVVSSKIASVKDYFLAGRSLGIGLATFSIFATWFGAETCMGSSAVIFGEGLAGSRADPFGYTICLLLMGVFLASALWKRDLTTLADLYRHRFSANVEKLAVWIMVPTSIVWAAAQVRAFGHVLSISNQVSVEIGITIAASVVVLYTFMSGLWGDVVTDFIQGIVLIIGLVIIFIMVFVNLGGVGPALQMIDPAKLNFTLSDESWLARMDAWMIPILGSLTAQELISRVLACRSAKVARRASLVASGLYLVIGIIPVLLGLLGPYFVFVLSDHDQFLPTMAKQLLPTSLFVIFSGALISAILSTVDSTLLAVSALLSNNFVIPLTGDRLNEKQKVRLARGLVLLAGMVAYLLALYGESIYDLIETTSTFGAAGVLVITCMGLWTRVGGELSAAAALVVGLITTPLARYVFMWEAPFVTSIAASLFTYLLVELVVQRQAVIATTTAAMAALLSQIDFKK